MLRDVEEPALMANRRVWGLRVTGTTEMTWQAINYGRVVNDQGVSVVRSGSRELKYTRGDRAVTIDVESGRDDLGVYARSVDRWDESGETISEAERTVIVEDVTAALRVLRIPFKLLWI
jgi:hypothetical protein